MPEALTGEKILSRPMLVYSLVDTIHMPYILAGYSGSITLLPP